MSISVDYFINFENNIVASMELLKQKIPGDIYEVLINVNIRSLATIVTTSKTELSQITKLDENRIEMVVRESAVLILREKILTANHLTRWPRISTGCVAIDKITRGGIPINGITEIVGCSGVGKTQLCLQLALMTQLSTHLGGLGKSVVYICTEDVFPAKRLNELSEVFTHKDKDVKETRFEDNVYIEHVADVEQLKRCLYNQLPKLLSVKDIGLVLIDSIAGVFRSENVDVNYTNRSQDFIAVATKINRLSKRYGFAIICVNQVTDSVATGNTEPCLGLAWSNVVTARFNINRYLKNQIREFEVVFAPDLPSASCEFMITKEGLVGVS